MESVQLQENKMSEDKKITKSKDLTERSYTKGDVKWSAVAVEDIKKGMMVVVEMDSHTGNMYVKRNKFK